MPTEVVPSYLIASTLRNIKDKAVDALYQKTPFLAQAKKHGGIDKEGGGTSLDRPLEFQEHSNITEHFNGYEKTNQAVKPVLENARYKWAFHTAPVILSHVDETLNKGEKAVIKLVTTRMNSVMAMLKRNLSRGIMIGDSPQMTILNSLYGGKTTSAGLQIGFLEALTNTNQISTVGQLSKATFKDVEGWNNEFVDIGGNFSTNGIQALRDGKANCDDSSLKGEINSLFLSRTSFQNYRRTLDPNERFTPQDVLDKGRMTLKFDGADVEREKLLDALTYKATGKPVSGYMISFEYMKLIFEEENMFSMTDFREADDIDGRKATVRLYCQLVADHLASQAIILDANTWTP